MIPSIDYLSLIVAGGILWFVGQQTVLDGEAQQEKALEYVGFGIAIAGTILFIIGAVRSLTSALGW